jgi:hypothetical protein
MLIGTELGLDNDCTKKSKQKLCTRLAATREVSGRKELKMREGAGQVVHLNRNLAQVYNWDPIRRHTSIFSY